MPGIDGIEVTQPVKQTRPEIESSSSPATVQKMTARPACAWGLRLPAKPVDIEVLTETLKQANEKMRRPVWKTR
jgi:CheY-like chemotaxis protein